MPQADRQERRIHRRAGPFEGAWGGAAGVSGVRIADLSEGGCFVESLSAPTEGDGVIVRLALTPSSEVTVEGHVTKVEPGLGFGVQFAELKTEQREAIREAVRNLLSGDRSVAVTLSHFVQSSAGLGAGAAAECGYAI